MRYPDDACRMLLKEEEDVGSGRHKGTSAEGSAVSTICIWLVADHFVQLRETASRGQMILGGNLAHHVSGHTHRKRSKIPARTPSGVVRVEGRTMP